MIFAIATIVVVAVAAALWRAKIAPSTSLDEKDTDESVWIPLDDEEQQQEDFWGSWWGSE